MIIEVFRDKDLLARVRAELQGAKLDETSTEDYFKTILGLPILQSVHAEVLRLYVEVESVFMSTRHDIRINQWRFPRNSLLLLPTGPAHRDESFWNTREGQYPLDQFWADRFLAYTNDPKSGPRKKITVENEKIKKNPRRTASSTKESTFINSGLANSYMPFGVGDRACPGRFFARREMIAFCALIVDRFEIDILSTEKEFKISPAFYGFGTQRPHNNIAFRIRHRAQI